MDSCRVRCGCSVRSSDSARIARACSSGSSLPAACSSGRSSARPRTRSSAGSWLIVRRYPPRCARRLSRAVGRIPAHGGREGGGRRPPRRLERGREPIRSTTPCEDGVRGRRRLRLRLGPGAGVVRFTAPRVARPGITSPRRAALCCGAAGLRRPQGSFRRPASLETISAGRGLSDPPRDKGSLHEATMSTRSSLQAVAGPTLGHPRPQVPTTLSLGPPLMCTDQR